MSNRPIVLTASRFRMLYTSTRGPEVTAKRSFVLAAVAVVGATFDGAGKLMCETGHDAVDTVDRWSRNDFQYRCSAVKGAGPEGSFSCCKGTTSAAIVMRRIVGSEAASTAPFLRARGTFFSRDGALDWW